MLSLSGERLSFSHPLFKAVAYERATPAERRRAHAALAAHCEADARAWHLAAATVGLNDGVADLLEAAARRASARGAHSVAADALQRSAQFSEEAEARTHRTYGAALAAALGGDYQRCAALLEPLTDVSDPLMRAHIRHTVAVVTMTGGMRPAPESPKLLSEEAERILAVDPATADRPAATGCRSRRSSRPWLSRRRPERSDDLDGRHRGAPVGRRGSPRSSSSTTTHRSGWRSCPSSSRSGSTLVQASRERPPSAR